MLSILGELPTLFINGMGIAAGLFLISSGLSIIFGVSRVYNFAHGSLYMLGAYLTYTILTQLPSGPQWFVLGILLAACAVGLLGLVVEVVLLRRIYGAPHHLQIIATFGLFLIIRDITLSIWGPVQLVTPSVPGLTSSIDLFGHFFPAYYAFMFAVGLVVFGGLIFVFHKTRWGVLLRAAIHDRDMVAALGVNQKLLFTSVFVMSAFLAGLAGGMDTLRISSSLDMDINLIIDAFAVVVIGGMGSILGSLVAAILVGLLTAVGTAYFPELAMALVFITMAAVLLVRPNGLFGKASSAISERHPPDETVLAVSSWRTRLIWCVVVAGLAAAPFLISYYWIGTVTEILIYVLFAWSFYFLAGPGGMISLGHAAFFGIGIYVPALLFKFYGVHMSAALFIGPLSAGLVAAVVGIATVRLIGIYFGMLTLALAQILWSVAYQWMDLTNGELGIIGIWPDRWASDRRVFYLLTLALTCSGVLVMRRMVFSPFGYGLRAGRDSPGRAEAIGIDIHQQRWLAYIVAAAFGGLAGTLMLYQKGGAFPGYLDLSVSLDVYIMALLGGLQSLNGPIVGAVAYLLLKTVLQTRFEHWNFILGMALILIALFLPRGVSGVISDLGAWRVRRQRPPTGSAAAEIVAIASGAVNQKS